MRNTLIALALTASVPIAAQAQTIKQPLPPLPPAPAMAQLPLAGGPTGRVDALLERMLPHLAPDPSAVDQAYEQSMNREINLSRSVRDVLKPVGFVRIGDQKTIYASEDGHRLSRLSTGSRIGMMQIGKITEQGVTYTVGKRDLYAPLAYLPTDPPKPPDRQSSQQTDRQPATPVTR